MHFPRFNSSNLVAIVLGLLALLLLLFMPLLFVPGTQAQISPQPTPTFTVTATPIPPTPTDTPTPIPPTPTSTDTPTPIPPTPTPTSTDTPTPIPPTPTPTNTPTPIPPTPTPTLTDTPTPIPPTPTPTDTPTPIPPTPTPTSTDTPTPIPPTPTPTSTPLAPPTADAGGPYLVAVENTIPLDGSGNDPDGGALTFDWTATAGGFNDDTLEDPIYTAGSEAGIFELTLTVTDPGNLSDSDTAIVVVYDPEGGFVTGGGWIDSPAGACPVDSICEGAIGKATFAFVSKYQKGQSTPSGNTKFQFKAGNFNFHSDTYQWLVINQGGSNAQFKGEGSINGVLSPNNGPYQFMLWASDDNPDTFRIKIWYEAGGNEITIYDNGFDQEIGGGSIIIHTGKGK